MALYLGLDSSTQSLTAVVIEVSDRERRVLVEHSLRFDEEFSHYGTSNGVLPTSDPLVAHSSPLMWAEVIDRMMEFIAREGGFPLNEIRAVSGSGQQHGSVYLNENAKAVLAGLDPGRALVEQLRGMYSRNTSPIWMDSSTRSQCDEITEAIGGDRILAELTGSRAFERFTGPQIRKFYQQSPDAYEKTDMIHLVSSYMASLLAGKHAPLDAGDASGMNLMDLRGRRWAPRALEATAPGLAEKLPRIRESWHVVGRLAPYWVERYGFPAGAKVVAWSGDNPCSLIGVGLVETGRIAISLGTSDTVFGFMPEPSVDPDFEGHAFGSPTGDYMSLICFRNGSIARERIRKQYGLDWDGFSRALRDTPPGNGGGILLPWFEAEITPKVFEPGVRRYGLDPDDGPANVRAVIEAQMMSIAIHSRWTGVETLVIHATGGASKNREILEVMADVQGAEVYQFRVGNSAALGAALRAYHADRSEEGTTPRWRDIIEGFAEPVLESRIQCDPGRVALYDELKKVYAACEAHVLRQGSEPRELMEAFRRIHGVR